MANDLLQLDFVVKQVGLDKALTLTAKFEREIMKTVNAYQKGQITQDRYQKSLLNTKRQMAALTNENGKQIMSIHKANAVVQRFIATQGNLNKSLNANSAAMQQTKRNTNQLGVLFQQSGYQIGDFAVQVQSGTNVMVAFGQQATQLIGTFAMLAKSTAAIAAFSALGVIVPIATAIAGAFMRTAKSAEEAKDKVTGLTKTLRDFRQEQRALEQGITTDQLALVDRVNAIKELREEQLQLIKDLQTNSNASNIMNVDLSVAERLSALIGAAFDPSKQADAESTINTLNDLMDEALDQQRELQVKINTEYLKRIRSMEDANKLASIENKFGQDHVKYRNEVRRQAMNALNLEIQQAGVTELVAKRLRDRLNEEYDIIDAKADQDELDRLALARQEAIQNSYKSGLAVLQQMTSEVEKREAAVKRIKDAHEDQMGILRDQINLLEIESQFGKNSSEYRQESAKQARDAYRESREALGVKGNLLKREMELYDQLQASRREAELNLSILKAQARTPIYEPLTQAQIETNKLNQELIDGFNTANDLKKELGEGAYEALRLAGVDMTSPISDAKKEAAKLADEMGIALEAAIALKKAQNDELVVMSQPVVTGKVTDRYDVETLMRMGYTREYLISIGKIKEETNKAKTATEDLRTAYEKAMMTAKEFADALDQQVIGAVDGVSNAFSDFLQRGMKDFKSFVGSIKDMFIKLLADMAAMALKRRILIPIATGMAGGFGSTAAQAAMQAGTGTLASGTLGATLATGASNFGSAALHTVTGGTMGSVAAGSTMATIGAAAPYVAAAVALFSLFGGGSKPAISPENMNKVNQALEMTGQGLGDTGREAEMAAAALGEVAGGFDKLTQKAQFFYENFYSEAERQQMATEKATDQVTKAFSELNLAVPETRDQFRALVEAQDLMTEEGRDTYNALLDVAQAFAFVKKESQGLSEVEEQRIISDREKLFAERQAKRRAEGLTGRGGAVDTSEMSFFERASEINKSFLGIYVNFVKGIKDRGAELTVLLSNITDLNVSFKAGNIGLTDFLEEANVFAEKTREGFTTLAENTLRASTDIGLAAGGLAFSSETLSNFISGVQSRGAGAAQAMGQQFAQGGAGVSQAISEAYNFFTDLADFVAGPIDRAMGGLRDNLGILRGTLDQLEESETLASEALDMARENGQMVTEAQLNYYNDLTNNIGLTQEAAEVAIAEMARLKEVSVVIPEQAAALEAAVLSNLSGGVVDTGRMVQLVATYGADLGRQIAIALANAANAGVQGVMSAFGQFSSLYSSGAINKQQYTGLTKEITSFLNAAKSIGGGGGGGGGGSSVNSLRESLISFRDSVKSTIDALKGLKAEEDELGGSRRREMDYLRSIRSINSANLDDIKESINAVKQIDKEDFASRLDYMREVGRTINVLERLRTVADIDAGMGMYRSAESPNTTYIGSTSGVKNPVRIGTYGVSGTTFTNEAVQEIRALRTEMRDGMRSVAKSTRKTADTLNKFDYDGLPDSRGF